MAVHRETATRPDGGRRQLSKGGFVTARQAPTTRTQAKREAKTPAPVADTGMTVGQWLPVWLATRYERGEIRDGTAEGYRDNIDRYLIPRLGHIRLVDLRGSHLTAAYDAIRRDRAEQITAVQAGHIGSSLSRLSNVVKRLEQRDLLRREPDPESPRYTRAALTDAGWDVVVAATLGHVAAVRRYVIGGLTEQQVNVLRDIACHVTQQIDKAAEEGARRG